MAVGVGEGGACVAVGAAVAVGNTVAMGDAIGVDTTVATGGTVDTGAGVAVDTGPDSAQAINRKVLAANIRGHSNDLNIVHLFVMV